MDAEVTHCNIIAMAMGSEQRAEGEAGEGEVGGGGEQRDFPEVLNGCRDQRGGRERDVSSPTTSTYTT